MTSVVNLTTIFESRSVILASGVRCIYSFENINQKPPRSAHLIRVNKLLRKMLIRITMLYCAAYAIAGISLECVCFCELAVLEDLDASTF
jgi:hypothetical protein